MIVKSKLRRLALTSCLILPIFLIEPKIVSSNEAELENVPLGCGDSVITDAASDPDSDCDGIPDYIEGFDDYDEDGTPNYLDLDSDNDFLPDSGESLEDTDFDGLIDYLDEDSDNDGIIDGFEDRDLDSDGLPDYIDRDQNGNRILDWDEKFVVDPECTDFPYFSEDGMRVFEFDGAVGMAFYEVPMFSMQGDMDSDSIPNQYDRDIDGDGIRNSMELTFSGLNQSFGGLGGPEEIFDGGFGIGGPGVTSFYSDVKRSDVDCDGLPNWYDLDSDNDGWTDFTEGTDNFDSDSLANFLDIDSDNDGVPDYQVAPVKDDSQEIWESHLALDVGDELVVGGVRYASASVNSDLALGINTVGQMMVVLLPSSYLTTTEERDFTPNDFELQLSVEANENLSFQFVTGREFTGIFSENYVGPETGRFAVLVEITQLATSSQPGSMTYVSNKYLENPIDASTGTGLTFSGTSAQYVEYSVTQTKSPYQELLELDTLPGDTFVVNVSNAYSGSVVYNSDTGSYDSADVLTALVQSNELTEINQKDQNVAVQEDFYVSDLLEPVTQLLINIGVNFDDALTYQVSNPDEFRSAVQEVKLIWPSRVSRSALVGLYRVVKSASSSNNGIVEFIEYRFIASYQTEGATKVSHYPQLSRATEQDSDGDGIADWLEKAIDEYPLDTDGDGTPDFLDLDSDGDLLSDNVESIKDGVFLPDSDGYGNPDFRDQDLIIDTDNDGIPNRIDTDDDNDGYSDLNDVFPLNPTENIDSDNDGLGNTYDPDDDNDGFEDTIDELPLNPDWPSRNDGSPGLVNLLSPKGMSTSPTPIFTWGHQEAVERYRLRVVDSGLLEFAHFKEYLSSQVCSDSTCSVEPNTFTLSASTDYRWSVQAQNESGWNAWAPDALFDYADSLSRDITALEPLTSVETASPTFSWEDLGNVSDYKLVVVDKNLTSQVHNENYLASDICAGGICSVTPAITLNFSQKHSWKVRAKNSAGWNELSPAFFFNYVDELPGIVSTVVPVGSVTTARPAFIWQELDAAIEYRLIVNDKTTDSQIYNRIYTGDSICSNSQCSVVPDLTLMSSQQYSWRVRAKNSAGWDQVSQPEYFNYSKTIQDPGFLIGEVTGNTAWPGSRATFTLELKTEPTSEVIIPIESTDPSEGIPISNQIVFPAFDRGPYDVVIKGVNPAVVNGLQDYSVVLGSAVSEDFDYSGLDPDDVKIPSATLSVNNSHPIIFVSDIQQQYQTTINSNIIGAISHSVISGPSGLSVTDNRGKLLIDWNPPKSTEGNTYDIEIASEIRGVQFTNYLTVKVLKSSIIAGNYDNNRFIASSGGATDIDGLILSYLESMPENPGLRHVPLDDMPNELGANFLTQGFYTIENEPVDLYFPLDNFGDINGVIDLAYYRWSKVGRRWIFSTGLESLQKIGSKLFAKLRIPNSNGLGVVALRPPQKYSGPKKIPAMSRADTTVSADSATSTTVQPAQGSAKANDTSVTPRGIAANLTSISNDKIECRQRGFFNPVTRDYIDGSYRYQECEIEGIVDPDGKKTVFRVDGFGDSTRVFTPFGSEDDIKTLMSWVGQTRLVFDDLGLANVLRSPNDKSITIEVLTREEIFNYLESHAAGFLGGVASNPFHIALNVEDFSIETTRGTLVHEYFHVAQAVTKPATNGAPLIPHTYQDIGNPDARPVEAFLTEGTAEWFEDYMFEGVNGYLQQFDGRIHKIIGDGVFEKENTFYRDVNGDLSGNPYAFGPFFMMLSSHCAGFESELKNLMHPSSRNEVSILRELLYQADCNFGPSIGNTGEGKLAEAFVLYQYATQYAQEDGKMKALDNTEQSANPILSWEDAGPDYKGLRFEQFSDEYLVQTLSIIEGEEPPTNLQQDGRSIKISLDLTAQPHSAQTIELTSLWDVKEEYEQWLAKKSNTNSNYFYYPTAEAVVQLDVHGLAYDPEFDNIFIGILSVEPDFYGNGTVGGEPIYTYSQDDACNGDFVYLRNTEGEGMVTLVNSSDFKQEISLSFILRDSTYIKDTENLKSISRYRGIEFEDSPETITRNMDWESAVAYCSGLGPDWRIPYIGELWGTVYQSENDNAFEYFDENGRYWGTNIYGRPFLTKYGTPNSDTVSDLTQPARVRCVRSVIDSNACGIR